MTSSYTTHLKPEKLRGANATFLGHYAQWATHMLTLTLGKTHKQQQPSESELDHQIRHIKSTLNWAIWGNRTKRNTKAKILFIPIVEGLKGNKRAHIHILLGNIRDELLVQNYLADYIMRSACLGPIYDLRQIHSSDGLSWYLTKETRSINPDAIRWESALIPSALIPKQITLLNA